MKGDKLFTYSRLFQQSSGATLNRRGAVRKQKSSTPAHASRCLRRDSETPAPEYAKKIAVSSSILGNNLLHGTG
jgi:hypothetical protein